MTIKQKIIRVAALVCMVIAMNSGFLTPTHAVDLNPINTNSAAPVGIPTYNGGTEQSIRDYLCVPDDANIGTAIYTCVQKLYRFGIAFGSIRIGVFCSFGGLLLYTRRRAERGKR